jgi:hypothetical protein
MCSDYKSFAVWFGIANPEQFGSALWFLFADKFEVLFIVYFKFYF